MGPAAGIGDEVESDHDQGFGIIGPVDHFIDLAEKLEAGGIDRRADRRQQGVEGPGRAGTAPEIILRLATGIDDEEQQLVALGYWPS
jgi:hypothetical protein